MHIFLQIKEVSWFFLVFRHDIFSINFDFSLYVLHIIISETITYIYLLQISTKELVLLRLKESTTATHNPLFRLGRTVKIISYLQQWNHNICIIVLHCLPYPQDSPKTMKQWNHNIWIIVLHCLLYPQDSPKTMKQ